MLDVKEAALQQAFGSDKDYIQITDLGIHLSNFEVACEGIKFLYYSYLNSSNKSKTARGIETKGVIDESNEQSILYDIENSMKRRSKGQFLTKKSNYMDSSRSYEQKKN